MSDKIRMWKTALAIECMPTSTVQFILNLALSALNLFNITINPLFKDDEVSDEIQLQGLAIKYFDDISYLVIQAKTFKFSPFLDTCWLKESLSATIALFSFISRLCIIIYNQGPISSEQCHRCYLLTNFKPDIKY